MAKYRVRNGLHVDGEGVEHTAKKNPIFTSECETLCEKFPNRFIKLSGKPAPAPAPEPEIVPEEEVAEDDLHFTRDPEDETPEENPLGDDVTSEFPKAASHGLLVFKKGKVFSVAEKDESSVAVSKEELKKVKDVSAFIEKFTA